MQSRSRRLVIWLAPVTVLAGVIGTGLWGVPVTGGKHTALAQTVARASDSELDVFMAKAVAAVNSRQTTGLKPMTVQDAPGLFAWVPEAHETWQGATMTAPMAGETPGAITNHQAMAETLAVFHAWHSCQSDGDHVYRLTHTNQGWQFGAEIPETETLGLRVRDHNLHVTLNIPKKTAQIMDTVQIERTAETVPAFGLLRLSHDFQVQSVVLGGAESKTQVRFRQAGGVLAFAPPPEAKFVLTLRYAGRLDNKESDYIRDNEAVLCSYWYPHIARLPATTTVSVTPPAGWTGVAQGEPTNETRTADGAKTATFRNEVPNCFFTLDVGRYILTSRQVKNRTLTVYQLHPDAELAKSCLDTLTAALDYYERNFAPFPFHRYGIVETNGAFSGALEAYSFATFGPNTLPDLLPHELAHTWWGGITPCTYTRSMWDEAFAEYSDDLFTRSRHPTAPRTSPVYPMPTKLLRERTKMAQDYAAVPIIHAFDTENNRHIAVGYEKGRQVLKRLEAQLGQETMLRCMRRFFNEHPKGEAAEWSEFEAAVNKETREDYHWFFAEWLERKGVPVLKLAHVSSRKEGQEYIVEADVVQEGSPYRLQMPVLLETSEGRPVLTTAQIDGATTHLMLRSPAAPTRLRLDPQGEVPFAPPLNTPAGADPTLFTFAP